MPAAAATGPAAGLSERDEGRPRRACRREDARAQLRAISRCITVLRDRVAEVAADLKRRARPRSRAPAAAASARAAAGPEYPHQEAHATSGRTDARVAPPCPEHAAERADRRRSGPALRAAERAGRDDGPDTMNGAIRGSGTRHMRAGAQPARLRTSCQPLPSSSGRCFAPAGIGGNRSDVEGRRAATNVTPSIGEHRAGLGDVTDEAEAPGRRCASRSARSKHPFACWSRPALTVSGTSRSAAGGRRPDAAPKSAWP